MLSHQSDHSGKTNYVMCHHKYIASLQNFLAPKQTLLVAGNVITTYNYPIYWLTLFCRKSAGHGEINLVQFGPEMKLTLCKGGYDRWGGAVTNRLPWRPPKRKSNGHTLQEQPVNQLRLYRRVFSTKLSTPLITDVMLCSPLSPFLSLPPSPHPLPHTL